MKSTSEKLRERVRVCDERPPGEEVSRDLRGFGRSEPCVPDAGEEVSLEEGEGEGDDGFDFDCVQSDICEIMRWNIAEMEFDGRRGE